MAKMIIVTEENFLLGYLNGDYVEYIFIEGSAFRAFDSLEVA